MIRKIGYTLALLSTEMILFFFSLLLIVYSLSNFPTDQVLRRAFQGLTFQAQDRLVHYYIFYIIAFFAITLVVQPKRKLRTVAAINAGLYMLITIVIQVVKGLPILDLKMMMLVYVQAGLALLSPYLLNKISYFRSVLALDIFPENFNLELSDAELQAK